MKIKDKNKLLKYTIIIFVILFTALFFLFKSNISQIKRIKINDYNICSTDNFEFNIMTKGFDNDVYEIEGYVYEKNNNNLKISSIWLVLSNDDSEGLLIPTYVKYLENNRINEIDYGWSGFVSYIDKNKIDLKDEYKVYLLTDFNEEKKLVNINIKLSDILKSYE